MSFEVLYSDITVSLGTMAGRSSVVNYGIVSERQTTKVDVVVVRGVPARDVITIPDPDAGLTEAEVLRRKLSILTGAVSHNRGIYSLENPKIVKEIDSEVVSSEIIKVAQGMQTGEIPYTNNIVPIDGLNFKMLMYKPPESMEEFETVLTYLYIRTSGRKRVLVSSPAFVEVYIGNEIKWCVVSIPRVLPYLWRVPRALVVAGMVDPGGFNAPFLVVKDMSWRELANVRDQMEAVKWLNQIISRSVSRTGGGEGSRLGEPEEPTI
ncbi:MAG: hypothetical protein QXU26_01425 [Thermofilaceae archaeon]